VIVISAKLKVLLPEEGGKRITGIKTGYRPNHVFELTDDKPNSTFIGEILFDDTEFIYPGEEKIVKIRFIKESDVENYLYSGRKWWVYEMPNLIARGEVLEIFQDRK